MRNARLPVNLAFAALACAPLAPVALGADHAVSQKEKTFSPGEVKAKVGDSITFANDDTVAHNVFSKAEGVAFNLKIQKPGDKSTLPLDKEGTFEVRCAIHPKMSMRVTVSK